MTFNYFARRLHLYLALSLLPWFLMYALSSMVLAHRGLFESVLSSENMWKPRFSKIYDGRIGPEADEDARKAFAKRVLDDHGLDCSFGVSPVRDGKINIWCVRFFHTMRVSYDPGSGILSADDKRFRVDDFLVNMHGRSGFQDESLLNDLWAIVVDLVSLGFLIWAATGIYLWWKLPRLRFYGTVSLTAGCATFIVFMITL
jgi:hypothetical protein